MNKHILIHIIVLTRIVNIYSIRLTFNEILLIC